MGATCSACAEKRLGNELIVVSEDGLAPGMEYPMWVIPVSEFLKIQGAPKNHNELITSGKLVKWAPGMFCIFLSHQWLSNAHPDPEGKQTKICQEALQNIINGRVSVQSDFLSLVINGVDKIKKMDPKRFAEGYVWVDWMAIPQLQTREEDHKKLLEERRHSNASIESCDPANQGADTEGEVVESLSEMPLHAGQSNQWHRQSVLKSDMHKAVHSIPKYVEYSDVFFVVAPTLTHQDTNLRCDLETWRKRGWCRVELACRVLSKFDTMVTSVQTPVNMQFMNPVGWLKAPACEGDFSVKTDNTLVYPVLEAAFESKVTHEVKIGETGKASFYNALKFKQLVGFQKSAGIYDEKVHSKPTFLGNTGLPGFTPLMAAAIANNVKEVRSLLEAKAHWGDKMQKDEQLFFINKGMTALHLAAMHNNIEALEVLLESKADLEAKDGIGCTVFTTSCMTSTPPTIERLLDLKAEINSTSNFVQATPLMHAGAFGNFEILEVLLRRGANVNQHMAFGSQALHSLAFGGATGADAKMLVDAKADINWQRPVEGFAGHLMDKIGLVGVAVGSTSLGVRTAANYSNMTPLMTTVLSDNVDMCEYLLKAKADTTRKNARGQTAMDIAKMLKADNLISVLDQHGAKGSVLDIQPDALVGA